MCKCLYTYIINICNAAFAAQMHELYLVSQIDVYRNSGLEPLLSELMLVLNTCFSTGSGASENMKQVAVGVKLLEI